MKYFINNVVCDTFAHIDYPKCGDTVRVSASDPVTQTIIAFLYCDNKEFPINNTDGLQAMCCVTHNEGKTNIDAIIGYNGEIIIPLPDDLCVDGQRLECEINIYSDAIDMEFRYKAFNFYAAVVP